MRQSVPAARPAVDRLFPALVEELDASLVRLVLCSVEAMPRPLGRVRIAAVLHGSKASWVQTLGLWDHPGYGALSWAGRHAVLDLVDALVAAGLVEVSGAGGRPTLDLSESGRAVLAGRAWVPVPVVDLLRSPTHAPSGRQAALLRRLRDVRARLARASGVPPYVVASDAVLHAIAGAAPADEAALSEVPGVGPRFMARWAEPVLLAIAATEEE